MERNIEYYLGESEAPAGGYVWSGTLLGTCRALRLELAGM